MKLLIAIHLIVGGITLVGCTKSLEQYAQEKQQEQKEKSEQLVDSGNEMMSYANCISAAQTNEAMDECDKMKENFSENTKRIMEKAKKNK